MAAARAPQIDFSTHQGAWPEIGHARLLTQTRQAAREKQRQLARNPPDTGR
ncbi:MAG: hypothetical protein ACOVN8_02205 [Burkholderiaceae bacterium]